jgi:Uma2 family endonuclease
MVTKMPKSPEHGYSTIRLIKDLLHLVPPGWTWRPEQPIRIPDYDEPEPDISIVRGSDGDYEHRLAGPIDVGLLIEVSRTTLDLDPGPKLSVHATSGIPIYWIVNVVERQVEVYTGPGPGAYQMRMDYKTGQAVPVVLDGQHLGEIAVDDILPSSRPSSS